MELHRVITSEEALQSYTRYILATPEIGLGLSNNPDLYHRSVSGTEHSCVTLPSQGHYSIMLCTGRNIHSSSELPVVHLTSILSPQVRTIYWNSVVATGYYSMRC